jgi:release factor glutamine methyltransferase
MATSQNSKDTKPAEMTSTEKMTIREAFSRIQSEARSNLPNKDADTVRIMEYVAELNETGILQNLDKPLTGKQISRLEKILERLQTDEPLEYILGSGDFHGRRFYVSPHTLIPRPETEILVDLLAGYAHEKLYTGNFRTGFSSKGPTLSIADVGTGTGCIIISTALIIREPLSLYATDISSEAIATAERNLEAYKLKSKITMRCGNLLEPVGTSVKFDIIAANLPYITSAEMDTLQPSVRKYEPALALDGGKNGADTIRELIVQASDRMNPSGKIVLEIQPSISSIVETFSKRFIPDARTEIILDLQKNDRFLVIHT